MKFVPGDTYKTRFRYTQAEVDRFAEVTGDRNPLHADTQVARKSLFKRPIMHGFLGASVFSRALGMDFPGAGTIYLSQDLQFKRPMFVDTEYEAVLTVQELRPERHMATIGTQVIDVDSGEVTINGSARIMNPAIE